MQVTYKNQNYTLGKKERIIDSEAPAVRINMLSKETKVIGMMAPLIQVMISLNDIQKYTKELDEILKEKAHKLRAYIITTNKEDEVKQVVTEYDIHEGFISNEFKDFSLKFGVNINEELIANSLFIIDKEGLIKYKQIPLNLEDKFELEEFKEILTETINFKTKGHSHENWMGV